MSSELVVHSARSVSKGVCDSVPYLAQVCMVLILAYHRSHDITRVAIRLRKVSSRHLV